MQGKCFKINICKIRTHCPQVLKVHGKDMKNASLATYLGDVISETGKVDATVLRRTQKATGITNQITSMLSSICLHSLHFDIALVLREAKLINSIMVNSKVWHNVQLKHIQSLEKSDTDLLKNILKAHAKTSNEAFYIP